MDRTSIILLGLIGAILFLILTLISIMLAQNRKKQREMKAVFTQNRKNKKNRFYAVYSVFKNTAILKRFFARIEKSVKLIYPADDISIQKKVVQILLSCTAIMVLGIAGAVLLAGGNVLFLCSGVVLTIVVVSAFTRMYLSNLKIKILKQFANVLEDVRNEYNICHNVEDTIQNVIDGAPYEIGLHLERVLSVVQAVDVEYEIENYIGKEPNQYVLIFLALCATVKERGDTILEDGTSAFITSLNYIQEECNNEILAMEENQRNFISLGVIALCPIVMMKPLKSFAIQNFEGISEYYTGDVGLFAIIGVLVSCLAMYKMVCELRDGVEVTERYETIWSKLADNDMIKGHLNRIINANYTKYDRYDDALRGLGDHTGKRAFLLKRLVLALGTTAVILIGFIAGMFSTRYFLLHNFDEAFINSVSATDEYKDNMRYVASDYIKNVRKMDITEEELAEKIKNEQAIKIDKATEISSEIFTRLDQYGNTYFKWWQLAIALAAGIFAFYIPVIHLRIRKNLIEKRKQDEVSRFQSLVLILMHMGDTSVDTILEWMERFSYCYKENIAVCRINLAGGEEEALNTLRDRERNESFRNFVGCLLAIDDVGVEKAFENIKTSRTYNIKKREKEQLYQIKTNASIASLVAFIPFFIAMILYLIIPMGIYMMDMFKDINSFM